MKYSQSGIPKLTTRSHCHLASSVQTMQASIRSPDTFQTLRISLLNRRNRVIKIYIKKRDPLHQNLGIYKNMRLTRRGLTMTEVYGRIKPSFLYREEERYGHLQLGTQGTVSGRVWGTYLPASLFLAYIHLGIRLECSLWWRWWLLPGAPLGLIDHGVEVTGRGCLMLDGAGVSVGGEMVLWFASLLLLVWHGVHVLRPRELLPLDLMRISVCWEVIHWIW